MEANYTSKPKTYLEVKRLKVKVTRYGPINVRLIEAGVTGTGYQSINQSFITPEGSKIKTHIKYTVKVTKNSTHI